MKFNDFYNNRPSPVTVVPDTETKFVDQSEADRCSLKFQLERYGMDSLQQQLQKTMAQFGYADTRMTKDFVALQKEMAEANSYFMNLPSRIRAQYNHDATKFFTELEQNPKLAYDSGYISKELAIKLGVIKAPDTVVKPSDTVVKPSDTVVKPSPGAGDKSVISNDGQVISSNGVTPVVTPKTDGAI